VVNVDIGGGSSNAELFRSGRHIASAASMVGGRQAVLEKGTGRLLHLAPTGRIIADRLGLGLRVGEIPRLADLKRLAAAMADIVVDLCLGVETPLGDKAALSPRLDVDGRVSAYFVSGGVGQLYYAHAPASTLTEVSVFGDIGPLLAEALRENPRWAELRVEQPAQTLRATVLGAASQQVTLSGSTIWAEDDHLPLRNAPVIEPHLLERDPGLTSADAVAAALGEAVERWDRGAGREGDFAISLPLPGRIDFAQLTALADGVVAFARRHLPRDRPLVLVIEQDYAQVLGQTVKQKASELALIVVDQIQLGEGDFIDIGEPLFDGRVVPVSVKTLVFYQATENKTRPGS
jgi:ethanolamine utilization protein EutA